MPSSTTGRDALLLSGGALIGAASCYLAIRKRNRSGRSANADEIARQWTRPSLNDLPPFAQQLESDPTLHRVSLREWEDAEWRRQSGWLGRDYIHNASSNAVQVLSYYYDDNAGSKEMIGVVWFGPDAESHRGLCHGGAMSSLFDDFCGHCAFVTSDAPWSGATVQVNVALKKPVRVGSVLRIAGRVTKRERRKAYVEAVLDNGGEDPVVFAQLEGLSIDGVQMSEQDDEVSKRQWEVHTCDKGRQHRRDSGWNIQPGPINLNEA
jgi:acyl-coenzyme A thioesterase PaaI-like protein